MIWCRWMCMVQWSCDVSLLYGWYNLDFNGRQQHWHRNKTQGHPNDYVDVNIAKIDYDQYVFTQPLLIDMVINDVGISSKQRKPVPFSAHKLLHHHLNSPPHNPWHFNFRSIVGKFNYLVQISGPDICHTVHQCAKYSSHPCAEHTETIVYLAKYLNSTWS